MVRTTDTERQKEREGKLSETPPMTAEDIQPPTVPDYSGGSAADDDNKDSGGETDGLKTDDVKPKSKHK